VKTLKSELTFSQQYCVKL